MHIHTHPRVRTHARTHALSPHLVGHGPLLRLSRHRCRGGGVEDELAQEHEGGGGAGVQVRKVRDAGGEGVCAWNAGLRSVRGSSRMGGTPWLWAPGPRGGGAQACTTSSDCHRLAGGRPPHNLAPPLPQGRQGPPSHLDRLFDCI